MNTKLMLNDSYIGDVISREKQRYDGNVFWSFFMKNASDVFVTIACDDIKSWTTTAIGDTTTLNISMDPDAAREWINQ